MYIVGIDNGKTNHEATIIYETGTLIGKSLKFSNSHVGADKLIDYITKNIGQSDVTFVLEATGHYWLSLYSFLLDKGYTINGINPIQSDSFRNLYIRQTKNDTKDSFIIAEVIRFGRFTTTKLADDKLLSLRQLCRYRLSLVDSVSELKCRIITVLDQVLFIEAQIKSLDKEIEFYYNKFDCHLTSIPGIGAVTAVIILSEIGDIKHFNNSASLVAYAGIDPTVKQSGQFSSNNNRMSKRGSPYPRRSLFLAASTCTLHKSSLNDYYNKKRSEGKHHLTAVGAVAHELTHIVFAIMRDNKDYETLS